MTVTINGTSGITTPGLNSTASNVLGDNVADTLNVGNGVIVTNSSGNVGVGTSSPSSVLDVRKDTAAGRTNITFTNGAAANTSNKLRLRLAPDVNFVGTDLQPYVESYVENASNDYSGLAFGTYNGSSIERMRIDSSGRVLYGTSSSPTSGGLFRGVTSTTDWSWGPQTTATSFVVSNASSAGVYLGNGNTSWSAISDERRKDIIEPITNGLGKITQLRAVIGKYKNDSENKRRSFVIAQDVQKVLPEAVSIGTDDEGDFLGVQYTELIPLLISSIQELNAKVTSLEEQVLNLGVTK